MKRLLVFAFIILLTVISVTAQEKKEPILNIAKDTVPVFLNNSNVYELLVPAIQIVNNEGGIQLYPTNKNYLVGLKKNSDKLHLRTTETLVDSTNTIIISFSQIVENSKHKNMMLKIYNPYSQTMGYDVQIYLHEYDKWIESDVMSIQPKLSSFEFWPDIITSIYLDNFRLIEKD